MSTDDWGALDAKVHGWSRETLAAALAAAGLGAAAQATAGGEAASSTKGSTVTKAAALSEDEKAMRKALTAHVQLSHRVYGVIYAALPDDVRLLVEHLPQGWAFGLWEWLEKRYQSTEQDNVGALLADFFSMRQDAEESFDAFKARVDKLKSLLKHAKQPLTPEMYSHTLLDKLLPLHKQAVLALKAGGNLKDLAKVDWESVAQYINAQARAEQRLGATEEHAMAAQRSWASRAGAGVQASPKDAGGDQRSGDRHDRRHRGRDRGERGDRGDRPMRCFLCDKEGHPARKCPLAQEFREAAKAASSGAGAPSASAPSAVSSASKPRGPRAGAAKESVSFTQGSNRFDPLSSDEESDSEESEEEVMPESEADSEDGAAAPAAGAAAPHTVAMAAMDDDEEHQALASVEDGLQGNRTWDIDTMASLHVSGDRSRFGCLYRCKPVAVTVADGSKVLASLRGKATMVVPLAEGGEVRLSIHNVYFHQRFQASLLSWNVLKDRGWSMTSDAQATKLATPGGNVITLRTHGRVSLLDTRAGSAASEGTAFSATAESLHTGGVKALVRLHERLGHVGFDRMVTILRAGHTLDLG